VRASWGEMSLSLHSSNRMSWPSQLRQKATSAPSLVMNLRRQGQLGMGAGQHLAEVQRQQLPHPAPFAPAGATRQRMGLQMLLAHPAAAGGHHCVVTEGRAIAGPMDHLAWIEIGSAAEGC
jgi:hypothetical protein